MTADPDQAFPLKNPRWEVFAQNVAKGMNNIDAYLAAVPVNKTHSGDRGAAKVSGHRLRQKEPVRARIDWLISEDRRRQRAIQNAAQTVPETFTRDDILQLFVEVSDTLQQAYVAAQDSSVPAIRLQQLRSVFADHTARLAKLNETETIPDNDNDAARKIVRHLNGLELWQT